MEDSKLFVLCFFGLMFNPASCLSADYLSEYETRRISYLNYCATNDGGIVGQLAKLELGQVPNESVIRNDINVVYTRYDCNEFFLAPLLRILYKYKSNLSRGLIAEMETCALKFRYWVDEPNPNGHCYWTENHQIGYLTCELLAGQLFKDRTFTNDGKNGYYHISHALPLVKHWLNTRAKFGLSEWLSNRYYQEDFLTLTNLYDFAEDPWIRNQAWLQF